jgi:hypothetical protein
VPVDVIHIKIADQQYWGRMSEVVALIEAARKRGVNVQANVYPYTRGNNNLSSIIPPWAHEGGTARMLERLKDPKDRERMKADVRGGIPGWYKPLTCGASCSPPAIQYRRRHVLYEISANVPDLDPARARARMIAAANAALRAGPRHVDSSG